MDILELVNVGRDILRSLPYLVEFDVLGNEFSSPVQFPFALYVVRGFVFLTLILLKLGTARL